ncbi:MAG: multiheme c-type cytochrome, partial [Planctomycetota bacterium]
DAAKPPAYMDWAKPDLTLVFTGDQHGYLEPCGCTGLDRQKGGVARRFTFLKGLRDRGWELAPLDVGNQVRRFGVQAETKLRRTIEALNEMGYVTTGIGPDDVELGFQLLGAAQDIPLTSANVVLYAEEYSQPVTLIEKGGQRVAVSALLDPKSLNSDPSEDIVVGELKASAAKVAASGEVKTADFSVMMFYGDEDKAKQLMVDVPGFDLWVVSGGYGEPTFEPMKVEGTASRMILTGNKGMYAGLVGLSRNADFKYARVPLTHEFADAPEMRRLMADYQNELKQVGLEGLGLLPATPHLSGDKFVGSQTCGKCHTSAMEVWENSMHALATDDIVQPPEGRGDVARHFDPECLSCHVTGWNPQNYYPYESGYVSLEKSKPLVGNGCENCHGPGAAHSAAEMKGSGVAAEEIARLREAMKLPLSRAKEKCLECHDLDNSPDFHEPGAFEDVYWPEVEHYGKD